MDERAKRILFDTYWTPKGWHSKPQTSAEDFAYAKWAGLMFDPISLSHNEAVKWALRARDAISPSFVISAFLASLGSRRLDLRSGLGSYAVVRHMRDHDLVEWPGGFACRVCGTYHLRGQTDLNVLSFERLKWGGVRHRQPEYIGFDLSQLLKTQPVPPDDADYLILNEIIDTARSMPPSARLSDLTRALAKVFPSNVDERRALIGILGYCGILIDPERPDFRTAFVSYDRREETRHAKDDWPYPVQWWNGRFGVNENAVFDWFPILAKI